MKYISLLILFLSINLYSQAVYKTPSGKKYHLRSCRMVKNVSTLLSVGSATSKGLEPCKICKPPQISSQGLLKVPSKAKGINNLSRCKGKTKLGRRCKRKTRIGNDYCFQHLP